MADPSTGDLLSTGKMDGKDFGRGCLDLFFSGEGVGGVVCQGEWHPRLSMLLVW